MANDGAVEGRSLDRNRALRAGTRHKDRLDMEGTWTTC